MSVNEDYTVCYTNLYCTSDGTIVTTPSCDTECIINVGQGLLDYPAGDSAIVAVQPQQPVLPQTGAGDGVAEISIIAGFIMLIGVLMSRVGRHS